MFDFLEKITSFACLFGSGLNCIFHWQAHFLILSKSSLNFFADLYLYPELLKKGKHHLQKLNTLMLFHQEDYLCKLKMKGSNTDSYGTPEFIFFSQTFDHVMLLFVHDYQDNL